LFVGQQALVTRAKCKCKSAALPSFVVLVAQLKNDNYFAKIDLFSKEVIRKGLFIKY
jgi:hypothetical protein